MLKAGAHLDWPVWAAASVNVDVQGAFADIDRGFLRVVGRIKATVLLGFRIAAHKH